MTQIDRINPDAVRAIDQGKNWQAMIASKIPRWIWQRVTFSTFAVAAMSATVALEVLPPAVVVYRVKLKHSIQFGGGGATSVTIKLGVAGELDGFLVGMAHENAYSV